MATGNHIGVRSTGKRRSPMQGGGVVPPGQGGGGAAGGGKGAFSGGPGEGFDIPVPQNGVAVAYQELERILRSTTDAFNALHTAAGKIPWETHGNSAATAAGKYDKVREALEGVAAQVNEIGKNKELVNLLEKVGNVSTTLAGPRGLQVVAAAASAANRGQGLGDPNPNVYSNTGWKAQRLSTGAMDHDAMQLFDSIQVQLKRSYRSGRATIDPGTLEQRKFEIRHLLEEYKGLARAVATNDPGSISQTPMTKKQLEFFNLGDRNGNLHKLYEDLKGAELKLNERSIVAPPSAPRVATMGGRISAIGSLMSDFRENRNNRSILQAEKLHRAAVEALHDNRENMTRDEYITYRSRLNVYGSQIGTLLQQGKITPREASSAVGGGLRALAAEMNLMKNGGSSLAGVQTRLAEAQALFDANAPYINNPSRLAELQAGLQSRILQVSALGVTPGRTAAQDALAASAAIRRGFAWTGSYDADAMKATRGVLETQRNLAEAILKDDKTSAAARTTAEKEVSKLTAEMQKLDAVGNKSNGTFERLGRQMSMIAGTALGIYSISHALGMAANRAIQFDEALRRVDAQLQRLPSGADRKRMGDLIKGSAVSDALSYGMDIEHTLQLHQTAMMGTKGDLSDRSRLGRTLSQLAFTTPTVVGEYQSMIAPLTNAGLDAKTIDRFFQASQVMQGQLNLAPDRVRAAFSSIAANAAGIGVLTDWETAQAMGYHEAAASKDMVMGSKLNRLQMAFRNPKNLLKMQTILSRGNSRQAINGMSIEEIVNDQNPMLSIDRISKLYRSGEINTQELNAVAQAVDMWSSPGTMNLFKTGLDPWREKVRESYALADSGAVSTDKMAAEQSRSLQSSINRIQQSLGSLATDGINPLGRSMRSVAGIFEWAATSGLGKAINALTATIIAATAGIAAARGISAVSSAAEKVGGLSKLISGGAGGMGALLGGIGGIAITGLLTGVNMYMDHKREQEERRVSEINELSAVNVVRAQRSQDAGKSFLDTIAEIREARDNGTLTKERQVQLEDQIAAATGNRANKEQIVQQILAGQTSELERQYELITGVNKRAEDASNVTTVLNIAKAYEGRTLKLRSDPEASQMAMRGIPAMMNSRIPAVAEALDAPRLNYPNYPGIKSLRDYWKHVQTVWDNPQYQVEAFLQTLAGNGGMIGNTWLESELARNGGGAIGATREESLAAAVKTGRRSQRLGQSSRMDKYQSMQGDYASSSAWWSANGGKLALEFYEIFNNGKAIDTEQLNSMGKHLFKGKRGEELIAKGGALYMPAIMDSMKNNKELAEFITGSKLNLNPENPAEVADYFITNPDKMKSMPASAQRQIADYYWSGVAAGTGKAPSTMGVEGPAPARPKLITDLILKTSGMLEMSARFASRKLLDDTMSNLDTAKGFRYNGDWYTAEGAYEHDEKKIKEWYATQRNRQRLNPEALASLNQNEENELEQLRLKKMEADAMIKNSPEIERQKAAEIHGRLVKIDTLHSQDSHAYANSDLTMSGNPVLAQLGSLLTALGVARDEEAAAAKHVDALGTNPRFRAITGQKFRAQAENAELKVKAFMFGQKANLNESAQWRDDASRPVLSFASGEFSNNQEAVAALNRQISRQIALMEDDYALTEDKIKILKQVVSLEKQKVELDEDVIRARRAMQVGKEVQGQLVETIFSFNGANAAARGKNILGIMGNTATRGMVDGVGRAMDKYDNPLAKFASFLYDPTGAVNQQVAQQKLTDATLYLAGRIEELTSRLDAQYETSSAATTTALGGRLFSGGYGALTGFTLNGGSSAPRALASAAGSAGGTQVFSIPSGDGSGAIKMALGDILASGDSDKIFAAYQKDPNAVGKQLSDLGIAPDADGKYSQETIAANQGAISEAQAKRQDQARNNPFTGLFGGVQFGTSFWAAGGMGRGKFDPSTGKYTGLGATQSGTDPNGVWKQGSAGISPTGAVVGGAQVLMAGASAYYGNKGNGQASQNYAALGAVSTTAGSMILMAGAANAWNPVGWSLLIVGAIASIMSGFEAAEHKADEANKAYEKQRAEFEKMIAIQEEQKKSIGLMAERVISMRGDVSSNFEGVAASSFLSGRWANRAPQINVATLTVVANNPAELSQALTTALTTQVRQGL